MTDFSAHLNGLDAAVFAHLGDAATLKPQAGGSVACRVILERPRDAQRLVGVDVVMAKPTIQLPLSAAASLVKGDVITVAGRDWRIAESPRRPGDGRIWVAAVEDLGAA